MIDRDGICRRIKEARERAGLSQQQLADVLNVTVRSVQLYEANRVPWEHMSRICEVTGASLAWLMQGQEYSDIAQRTFDSLDRIEAKLDTLLSR